MERWKERSKEWGQKWHSLSEFPNNICKNKSQTNGKVAVQQYFLYILYKGYIRDLHCIIHHN